MSSSAFSTSAPPTATSSASATSTSACITAVPDKNGYVPMNDCRALYSYYPSITLAIVFATVFGISMCLHIFQAFKFKKRFAWVIIMGVTWEMVAFILRALSTRHQLSMAYYIPPFMLIFLAPLLLNAFDYMLLGRMIYYYIPTHSVFKIPATSLTKIFVVLDIVSFLIQATGGSMASGTDSKSVNLGLNIYMGGIGLQQLAILVFMALVVRLHMHLIRLDRSGQLRDVGKERGWKKLLYTLYASLACITIRIIFRLVEFSPAGKNSIITDHEVFFYVLDAVPMSIAAYLFNCIHPGTILVGADSEYPVKSRKEKKAEKEAKKEQKRLEKEAKKTAKWNAKNGVSGSVLPPRDYRRQNPKYPLPLSGGRNSTWGPAQGTPY